MQTPGAQDMAKLTWLDPAVNLDLLHALVENAHAAIVSAYPDLVTDQFGGNFIEGASHFDVTVTMDVAPRFLPAIPGPGAFPELNVRTYVRRGRRSGVWFFSLDAASRVAVEGARRGFDLPYYRATMSAETDGGWIAYRSERQDRRGPPAAFAARYRPIQPVRPVPWASLDRFLTDRFGLFAADADGRLSWTAIRHEPWRLQAAEAEIEVNTMTTALGIELSGPPALLQFARRTDVVAWWPRPLERRR